MSRPRWLVLLSLLALVLAGCSGIPRSSRPSTVETVPFDVPSGVDVQPPPKNADPRTIVSTFLTVNGYPDPARDGAYQYLTNQAKSRWDSTTVTVLANEHVGVFDGTKVVVTGTEIGSIDRTGVYNPTLTGNGLGIGGTTVTVSYGMQQVGGQWRINTLANGLLLTTGQFNSYRQHTVYFFDAAEQHLVPDARWSPQLDPLALAQFLIGQLARGPRDNLQTDETTEFPAQSDPTRVLVTTADNGPDGGITKIEIPQSSQLGAKSLNLLAAQVANTLATQLTSVFEMEITDSGQPVTIQAAHGPLFTADQVTTPYVTSPNPVGLFYLNAVGGLVDESGTPLPGKIGTDYYALTSAAVANRSGGKGLLVVGTRKAVPHLDIGSLDNGGQLTPVNVPAGTLSRPDWVPGLTEAWIGDGTTLYRILPNGKFYKITISLPSGLTAPQITAVRLSPEGARVAFVLTNPDGSSQIWIGQVVRTATQVQVNNLQAISPQGVTITDVAWNDELKLFAVGHDTLINGGGVYEVQVDGSLWTSDGIANLPSPPESITASKGLVAAVASGGTVWKQQAAIWVNLQGPGEDPKGSCPIYSS